MPTDSCTDPDLIGKIKALGEPIRAKGATGLYIYGSRARGDHRPDSDLDVLVDYEPGTKFSLVELAGIQRILEEALGIEVHVGTWRGMSPRFRSAVESEAVKVL